MIWFRLYSFHRILKIVGQKYPPLKGQFWCNLYPVIRNVLNHGGACGYESAMFLPVPIIRKNLLASRDYLEKNVPLKFKCQWDWEVFMNPKLGLSFIKTLSFNCFDSKTNIKRAPNSIDFNFQFTSDIFQEGPSEYGHVCVVVDVEKWHLVLLLPQHKKYLVKKKVLLMVKSITKTFFCCQLFKGFLSNIMRI